MSAKDLIHHPYQHSLLGICCALALVTAGCGGGGGGSGGDNETANDPPTQPTTLTEVTDASEVSFDFVETTDVSLNLEELTLPITNQTFVRLYRVDPDGSEHLISVQRLATDQAQVSIEALLPAGTSPDNFRYEVYGPDNTDDALTPQAFGKLTNTPTSANL